MNDAQRDPKPTVDTEPAAKIIEQWIKLREAQIASRVTRRACACLDDQMSAPGTKRTKLDRINRGT